ncbi:hypothetical protein RU639_003301 [Aspergillus parasiticus]
MVDPIVNANLLHDGCNAALLSSLESHGAEIQDVRWFCHVAWLELCSKNLSHSFWSPQPQCRIYLGNF